MKSKCKKVTTRGLFVLTALTVFACLIMGSGSGNSLAATPQGPVWAPPAILLPYVADNHPGLCVNPLDSTMSYLATSGGYGEVSGSEGNNWLNSTFTKLGDKPGSGGCAFDEFGTLHAVWSYRVDSGNFNIFYTSVQKGSGNVPLYRNLTNELYGQDKYTLGAHIAVSIPQHKVFIIYQERGEGGDPLMFIESSTQGDTWSKPVKLGVLSGYRPAEPDIIVDKQGLPHIFYGVFRDGGPSVIYHRMRRADGSWTPDENILGDKQTRPIWTQAELDPNSGEIYVSWLEVQSGVSRWNAATGKWSYSENISNSSARAFLPTIAVNSQTGVIWDIWTDDANIWSRQSSDHGQTWQPEELVVNLGAAKIGRMFGLKARSARGIIYLLISADQLNPLYYVGPTLFLMTFNQSGSSQPVPTATPGPRATGTPTGTATPVISATVSPAPITAGPTATPAITQAAPTITPQPTATPQPSATPALTATPMPTITPQPTATPQTFPTPAPLPTTTPAPTATATAKPLPTETRQPAPPAQGPAQASGQQPPAVTNTPIPAVSTATSKAMATINPEAAQATALAEAQRVAAATPQTLIVPLAPAGSGGRGPALVLPTGTPMPSSTPVPTLTPSPAPTVTPGYSYTAPAPTLDSTATAAARVGEIAQAAQTKPQMPTVPPPTGAIWLLPVGLAVTAKGALNLLALLFK